MARCQAIAMALRERGVRVTFCCHRIEPSTQIRLEQLGIRVSQLPAGNSFFEHDLQNCIVIVDGYHFNGDFWHRLLEAKPISTVAIDELRPVRYQSDFVICYNEGVQASEFDLAPHTRLYLGGRYLLLRPEIRQAARCTNRPTPRRALMLACGGTRQERWVSSMLPILARLDRNAPLWVLSGRRLAATRVLANSGQSRARVRFFSGLDAGSMMGLYRKARTLLTPASTVMLEAFAAGCPVMTGWIADNQRHSLSFYEDHGLVVSLGDLHQLSVDALTRAKSKLKRRRTSMIRKQHAYIQDSNQGIVELVNAILKSDKEREKRK